MRKLITAACIAVSLLNAGVPSAQAADCRQLAVDAANRYGIYSQYFVNQIQEESSFNPSAQAPDGGEGIAQIMPATARAWHVNPWDPAAALDAAAHHMSAYQYEFGGDYAKALAAYNAGQSTVTYAESHCGFWRNCLSAGVNRYIDIAMGASTPIPASAPSTSSPNTATKICITFWC